MNPIKITEDTKYPEMYRLEWADGVLSEDFYNLSRANDILKHYDDYVDRMKIADAPRDLKGRITSHKRSAVRLK